MRGHLIASVSWIERMESLSDSERGRLFVSLLKYAATGEKEEPRGSERVLFDQFCKDFDDAYIYIYKPKNNLSQEGIKGTTNLRSSSEDTFERFWNAWPKNRQVNRKRCTDLWRKIKPDAELVDRMIEKVEAWKKSRQWQTGYIPNPDKWLADERWNDATPDPWKDPRRNTMGHYKDERPPISEEEFDAMTVNLEEIRFD